MRKYDRERELHYLIQQCIRKAGIDIHERRRIALESVIELRVNYELLREKLEQEERESQTL